MISEHSLPEALYRPEQVRELDRIAIQERGIPGYALMERAGGAAFRTLKRHWPDARTLVVLCGGGNNGGDGYVIARLAQAEGLKVRVAYLSDPQKLRGDAAQAWRDCLESGIAIESFSPDLLEGAEVVVDALLGTGLEREVRGQWADTIAAVNGASLPVLAVDIPSGLSASSGMPLGSAVRADVTVTFIGLKQGLFTGYGPEYCGKVVFATLSVPPSIFSQVPPDALRYWGQDLGRLLPRRSRVAHKGDCGHVLVIGGDHGMAGAARLAAEAAARAGAGLVSVATRREHAISQVAARPEIMFRAVDEVSALEPMLARATVVAIGPGLGTAEWGRLMLRAALDSGLPLVVDADALNLVANLRIPARESWVLTPHPGEAARLLGRRTVEIQRDRFRSIQDLQLRYGGAVVLKGAGTLIRGDGKTPRVCASGNPGMASGGMGDVLTGVIAGLLAQGLSTGQAARGGAYLHGAAADLAAANGERGMLARDLMPHLRRLVNST